MLNSAPEQLTKAGRAVKIRIQASGVIREIRIRLPAVGDGKVP
jgi:hypothetical protein